MSIENIKPAGYSLNTSSDIASITTLKSIFDSKEVIAHLSENDKTPNYDGYLELIEKCIPIGEIKVQVKTLKNSYKTPSYNLKLSLLKYARDCQIPFLIIAVDQKERKAFWCEINHEKATTLINNALSKNKKTIAVKFEKNNEIPTHTPYIIWKTIIEEHKKLIHNSNKLSKQLIITEDELKKLKLKLDVKEKEESSYYVQLHIFLDTLNNLFSNEFKIIRQLLLSDFWKFGIATFGQITEESITYSLFSIGWNENLKQISEYKKSDDFQIFIGDYLSVISHSGTNPIYSKPINYAYEKLWEYLKLLLERNLVWPNCEYLQQEFLFYLKDTTFRKSAAEMEELDLFILKKEIDDYLALTPEAEKKLMNEFPQMNKNLYRALDYIQNFRIQGKTSINRLSPSKKSLDNIATSVGEKGKFPDNIKTTLFNYWNTLLNSYENVLDEFFPLVKKEFKNSSIYIIVPFIDNRPFNGRSFNTAYLNVLKLTIKNKQTNRKFFIELNPDNLKVDFKNDTVQHNEKKYKFSRYEKETINISSLIGDMPIRKRVYIHLFKDLKNYFENIQKPMQNI